MEIHPDDILEFTRVCDAMKYVARQYGLPLRSIRGLKMPETGMADRMGQCSHDGHIRLVLRCTVNGQWCEAPLDLALVWETAAHELAHLRHFDHGPEFNDFWEELNTAMNNRKGDHKERIIKKILKLKAQHESEASLGNAEAAQAFAAMMNKLLIQNEISPSELSYAEAKVDDPIIEFAAQIKTYGIQESRVRIAWQETLASIVARANLCRILVRPKSNAIVFVGTKSHTIVAEYIYGCIVPLVDKMSKKAEVDYWRETGCGRGADNKARGYRAAWINSFVNRIYERFEEAKQDALEEIRIDTGETSTALVRLNTASQRVEQYINDKFASKKATADALRRRASYHSAGMAAGREAANKIALGRRGITGGTAPKQLT